MNVDTIYRQFGMSVTGKSSIEAQNRAVRQMYEKMKAMYSDVSSREPDSAMLPVLKQGLDSVGRTLSSPAGPGGVGNFALVLPAMGEYHQYYSEWNTSFTNAERQRREFEESRKAQEEALRRQQRETARLNTYMSNVGSGDLSGPGTPPTVISGGSQNVDSSRLDIGRSSTARRRRGRGISAQLGL